MALCAAVSSVIPVLFSPLAGRSRSNLWLGIALGIIVSLILTVAVEFYLGSVKSNAKAKAKALFLVHPCCFGIGRNIDCYKYPERAGA